MQDGGQLDRGLGLAEVVLDKVQDVQGGDDDGLVLAAGAGDNDPDRVGVHVGQDGGQPAAVSATADISVAHHPGRRH